MSKSIFCIGNFTEEMKTQLKREYFPNEIIFELFFFTGMAELTGTDFWAKQDMLKESLVGILATHQSEADTQNQAQKSYSNNAERVLTFVRPVLPKVPINIIVPLDTSLSVKFMVDSNLDIQTKICPSMKEASTLLLKQLKQEHLASA